MTVLLNSGDLRGLLKVPSSLRTIRDGFLQSRTSSTAKRVRHKVSPVGTAVVLVPGCLPDVPAYTVKVNAKYPESVPAISGVICLHDLANGKLLSLLDSAFVTAWRTGLSAALGTHHLARPTHRLGVIGAGAQALITVRALATLRPITSIAVHDVSTGRAQEAARIWEDTGICCEVAPSAASVADSCDTLLLATWSREPVLDRSDILPGTHITSLGADEPDKQELGHALLSQAQLFVDDVELAATSGVFASSGLPADHAAGTLAQALSGEIPVDTSALTVYSPVGMPWQDLSIAWKAYQLALHHGTGTQFAFHTPT